MVLVEVISSLVLNDNYGYSAEYEWVLCHSAFISLVHSLMGYFQFTACSRLDVKKLALFILCRAQCEFCWCCCMTSQNSSVTTTMPSVMSFHQTASKSAISFSVRFHATCDFRIHSHQTWRSTCCQRSPMHHVSCRILSALFSRSHSRRLISLIFAIMNYYHVCNSGK